LSAHGEGKGEWAAVKNLEKKKRKNGPLGCLAAARGKETASGDLAQGKFFNMKIVFLFQNKFK
jgi:hypothetical protein